MHALATSSAFGFITIQLTDPTTNLILQVTVDFAALLDLFYICFHFAEAKQSDRIKMLGFSHAFYNVQSYPHWRILGMVGIELFTDKRNYKILVPPPTS